MLFLSVNTFLINTLPCSNPSQCPALNPSPKSLQKRFHRTGGKVTPPLPPQHGESSWQGLQALLSVPAKQGQRRQSLESNQDKPRKLSQTLSLYTQTLDLQLQILLLAQPTRSSETFFLPTGHRLSLSYAPVPVCQSRLLSCSCN